MTRIEIGVTHEVVINHDKAWIRLAITDDIVNANDDDLDEAISALSEKVNKRIIDVIEETVKTVTGYEETR